MLPNFLSGHFQLHQDQPVLGDVWHTFNVASLRLTQNQLHITSRRIASFPMYMRKVSHCVFARVDWWLVFSKGNLHRIRSFGLFMPSTITSLYKKSHDSERQVQYDLTLILRVRHYLNIRWPLIACHLVKRLISRQNCFYSGNFYKFYDAPNQREGSSHVHSLIRERYKPAGPTFYNVKAMLLMCLTNL